LAPEKGPRDDSTMSLPEERRQKRSDDPLVALHYQLAHARQEGRLDAMVVADDAGIMVAGAGAWALCEELAAYAPLLARGRWCEPGLGGDGDGRVAELRTDVDVQPVTVDGQTLLLCASGGWMRAMSVEKAVGGVARILGKAA
jgi:hypothetical protein